MKIEFSKGEAKNFKFAHFLTKAELLAIHEALAYVSQNQKEFDIFLNRNKPDTKKKILKAIGFLKEGGVILIGKIFRLMHATL